MFQPTYPIRTARLTLRPVTLDDLDDVYAYQRRPDVVRWMLGAGPRTREQSRASVVAMAGEDALRAEGDCLTLAVATGAGLIGTVELVWRSQRDRTAECARRRTTSTATSSGESVRLRHPGRRMAVAGRDCRGLRSAPAIGQGFAGCPAPRHLPRTGDH